MNLNTISDFQAKVLCALYAESCETRRDVTTVMVCIAANSGTEANQRKVIAALGELRELGLVVSSDGGRAWATTLDGMHTAKGIASGAIKRVPEEKSAEPKKPRATLRPVVGGAPRPVTRPGDVVASTDVAKPEAPAPTEIEGTVERVSIGINDELLNRAAAMVLELLAQTKQKPASPQRLEEMAWLQDTGRLIEKACGVKSRAEIDHNDRARAMLDRIVADYQRWERGQRRVG